MTLTIEKHANAEVVRMSARVDAAAADTIRADLMRAIGGESSRLLIDMSAVTFIDSSGLGVIVTAAKASISRSGSLALFALPAKVRSLIELTRLHLLFDIYTDEAAALAAVIR